MALQLFAKIQKFSDTSLFKKDYVGHFLEFQRGNFGRLQAYMCQRAMEPAMLNINICNEEIQRRSKVEDVGRTQQDANTAGLTTLSDRKQYKSEITLGQYWNTPARNIYKKLRTGIES